MQIEFIGGARTVTGSCYIIKNNDFTIMVDCGMFQGKRELRERNYLKMIHTPSEIDALILTHAHIDHSGLIPKLVKNGFRGKIFSTHATKELCSIMLPDSAHIQEMDTAYINKKNKKLGRDPVDPLYTVEDAGAAMGHFTSISYGEKTEVVPGVEAVFRDAGHILGSSFVEMWINSGGRKTKIVFSGDIGQKNQAIIRNPEAIEDADILLIESTYGDRLHKNKEDTYREFKEIINDSYNKEGNIIIPAFAIERTQEIIYTLNQMFKNKEIPPVPVYIDSPLAIGATEIFRKNDQCFDEKTRNMLMSGDSPLDFKNLKFTKSAAESKRLNDEAKGSIIISASGMCTAGRIKHHLQHNLYKPSSSVIFVGYQAEGTLGRRIIEGAKQVRVYGEDVAVKAKIHTLGGFSAHADRDGLLEWMSTIQNRDLKVFVVHGEEKSALSFADTIKNELGHTAAVPNWGDTVDLDSLKSDRKKLFEVQSFSPVDQEIDRLSSTLKDLIAKYNKAKENDNLQNIIQLQNDINDAREMISIIIDEL